MASSPDLNQPNLRPPSDVNPRSEPPLDFEDREFGGAVAIISLPLVPTTSPGEIVRPAAGHSSGWRPQAG